MSIIKEAKRREFLEKIQIIKKALPEIEKLVREGKIQILLAENLAIVDCLVKKIFEVQVKESKVSFLICEYD